MIIMVSTLVFIISLIFIIRVAIIPIVVYFEGGKYYFSRIKIDKQTKKELKPYQWLTNNKSLDGYKIVYDKKIIRRFVTFEENFSKTDKFDSINSSDIELMEIILNSKIEVVKFFMSLMSMIILWILNGAFIEKFLQTYYKVDKLSPTLKVILIIMMSICIAIKIVIQAYKYDFTQLKIKTLALKNELLIEDGKE